MVSKSIGTISDFILVYLLPSILIDSPFTNAF